MSRISGNIDNYVLRVLTPSVKNNYKRVITLYGSFGIALLHFVPEGGVLGTNRKRRGMDVFYVFFWESAWDSIVDIIRNEDPTTFFFHTEHNYAFITTAREPAGEEEIINPGDRD